MNFAKKIAIAITSGAGLLLSGSVFAVGNYITLPEGFVSDALAYVGGMFADLSVVIILAIGLPLAFYVIRKVVSLVRAR